jgi:hypothetical protein
LDANLVDAGSVVPAPDVQQGVVVEPPPPLGEVGFFIGGDYETLCCNVDTHSRFNLATTDFRVTN